LTVSHTNRWQAGKINCLDFHRKDDLLVTSSEDDSIRLYNTASAT
jgi:COMPASS component SWD2